MTFPTSYPLPHRQSLRDRERKIEILDEWFPQAEAGKAENSRLEIH